MKKLTTFCLVYTILLNLTVFGQPLEFEYLLPQAPDPTIKDELTGVYYSDVEFADVDNDGDDDLFITGESAEEYTTKLYLNDGLGNYTEQLTSFDGIHQGDLDLSDIDNDGDLDVFLSGENNLGLFTAKLYENDGAGSFFEISGTSFEPMGSSTVAFSDVENDGDQDLLMTGSNGFSNFANLYENDGTGSFTYVSGTSFLTVHNSDVVFFDSDGDADEDLLISGENSSTRYVEFYENDGAGNFIEVIGMPFVALAFGDTEASDIDNDGDLDLLMSGTDNSSAKVSLCYVNDGSGTFTELVSFPVTDLFHSSIELLDIDNDNDQDLLIVGMDALSTKQSELYENDGSGNFAMINNSTFYDVYTGAIASTDINGDGNTDILITGNSTAFYFTAVLYTGDGTGNFEEVTGSPLIDLSKTSIDYADIDNDLDLDIVMSGLNKHGNPYTGLYMNNGGGNFEEVSNPFVQVYWGVVKFSDFDGDNDPDLLVSGSSTLAPSLTANTNLYINDGTGQFTEISSAGISNVYYSAADFGDADSDGDLDLYLVGRLSGSSNDSRLYLNNGSGTFSAIAYSFLDIAWASVHFADIDTDGDLDIVQAGQNMSWGSLSRYQNDGAANFSSMGSPYDGVQYCSIDLADVNGDGHLDLMTTGLAVSYNAKLYLNNADGTGNFTLVSGTPFTPVRNSAIEFADVDGDNDEDLLITGLMTNSPAVQIAELFLNDGSGIFTQALPGFFEDVEYGDVAIADFDLDNDADIIISGNNGSASITRFYTNKICYPENILVTDNTICDGDSTLLFIGNTYDSYLWSNGSISSSIYVNDSAEYFVTLSNVGGCVNGSNPVSINIFDCSCPPDTLVLASTYMCQGDSVLLSVLNNYDNYLWSTGETTSSIYISDSSDYSVVVSNYGGCMNGTDTVSALVYDCTCPPENIIVSSYTICSTDSTELYLIDSFDNYQWSDGSTSASIFINDSAEYSVIVSNVGGCLSLSDTITVDVYDCTFLIDTINYALDSCLFDTVNIVMSYISVVDIVNDSVLVTWTFVSDSGSIFLIDTAYYFPVNGLYTISITVECGRSVVSTFYSLLEVTHMQNLSITESPHSTFIVYPNPAAGDLFVQLLYYPDELVSMQLTDVTGKIISDQILKDKLTLVEIEHLASGIYWINIISDGKKETVMFIKQ